MGRTQWAQVSLLGDHRETTAWVAPDWPRGKPLRLQWDCVPGRLASWPKCLGLPAPEPGARSCRLPPVRFSH